MSDETRRDPFENHVAKYEKHNDHLETLEWKKPGDSNLAIWYVRQYGTLTVWGDCYDAIYQWYPGNDLRWISTLNESYFLGKCQASPHGRRPFEYDYQQMEDNMKSYFADGCMRGEPMCPEGECEDCDLRRKEAKLFEENYGWNNMEDEFTWVCWLRENGDEVFGQDWWESIPNGEKLGPCFHLHLKGLKAAFAQLDALAAEKKVEEKAIVAT